MAVDWSDQIDRAFSRLDNYEIQNTQTGETAKPWEILRGTIPYRPKELDETVNEKDNKTENALRKIAPWLVLGGLIYYFWN